MTLLFWFYFSAADFPTLFLTFFRRFLISIAIISVLLSIYSTIHHFPCRFCPTTIATEDGQSSGKATEISWAEGAFRECYGQRDCLEKEYCKWSLTRSSTNLFTNLSSISFPIKQVREKINSDFIIKCYLDVSDFSFLPRLYLMDSYLIWSLTFTALHRNNSEASRSLLRRQRSRKGWNSVNLHWQWILTVLRSSEETPRVSQRESRSRFHSRVGWIHESSEKSSNHRVNSSRFHWWRGLWKVSGSQRTVSPLSEH